MTLKLSRTKAKNSKGFTLIELMIAVAIVGILAAIAVPAFGNYLVRARAAEAINYAQSCKTGVVEFAVTNGVLPANVTQANCPTLTTDNIQSVAVVGGRIQITFVTNTRMSSLSGRTLFLTPENATGARATNGQPIVGWTCGTQNPNTLDPRVWDLLPAICRNNPL